MIVEGGGGGVAGQHGMAGHRMASPGMAPRWLLDAGTARCTHNLCVCVYGVWWYVCLS